ncbi:MAG: hypothetical protein JXA21_11960 [Anaerolineae bacterium]|nr:hypothetical protein [Anaerolineae bacterium]
MNAEKPYLRRIISVIVLLSFVLFACMDLDEYDEENPDFLEETAQTAPATKTPRPQSTRETVNEGKPGTWLVMLYQDADDEILEQDIFTDLNEAEIVGSNDAVTIVAQLDRYKGAFKGDGNWTGTKRFLVTQDDDLTTIQSEEIADLGEVNSGDWNSLVDFGVWAIETYPAENYVLILSDHGMGWLGGWSDNTPKKGSEFSTNDIDQALEAIISQTGIGRFELVGFDACLMGQLEPLDALVPYAKVAVASEEVEPSLGWAYASFLQDLSDNPAMSAADLGKAIVESYITLDARIVDDDARRIYLEEAFQFQGEMSAAQVAKELSTEITLAAYDLTAMSELNTAVNELAVVLTGAKQKKIAKARSYTQSFESVFGDDDPPSFLDLGHFAGMLQDVFDDDATIAAAAKQVQEALSQAVIAEKHGAKRPGATGMSIYFPNSNLYELTGGPDAEYSYTEYASRFAAASLWDDFLRFHYTGTEFGAGDAELSVLNPMVEETTNVEDIITAPPVTEDIAAPGAGNITIAPVEVSAEEIGLDDTVTLYTDIQGENVAYVYLYASYFDEEYAAFLTADMQFVGAENTLEIAGVYYPDWGEEGVGEIEVDWDPTVYFMSNGETEEFAYFEPETYGVTAEEDTYIVYGVYTFVESGNERDAFIRFGGDGVMQSVFGFTGENGDGAPREITPQSGDTFTILEEWYEFDETGGGFVDYEGATLTFNDEPFEMVPYYGYTGDYVLGILVEDMNGNLYEETVEVTVKE